jgi:nicotinamidase-related amidase
VTPLVEDSTPESPALLVIDVQQGFDDPVWGERNNPQAEQRIAELLAAWRAAGAPIVHIRHRSVAADGVFRPDTPAFEFKAEAQRRPDEPIVTKTVNSGFIGTPLEESLRQAGIAKLVIVGFTTDHCCSTTTRMAANLGFDCVLVSDATATFARDALSGERLAADLVHTVELAALNGEFATVVSSDQALELVAR